MEKERKIQIIKAAVKRFSKHGLGKTTLDEIARDLRIGKATIYHYFESKDSLYFEAIRWEGIQFIEEIKNIFNNESAEIKERFLEYFRVKEEADNRYKMLYDLIVLFLKDNTFDREKEILQDFISREEEILRLFIGSIYTQKIETMDPALPHFIVIQSWGFLLAGKISHVSGSEMMPQAKQLFNRSLDSLLS